MNAVKAETFAESIRHKTAVIFITNQASESSPMSAHACMSIADNLKTVKERIVQAERRAGRDPSSIKLIVVTKTVDAERVREAQAAGAAILGENRVQEAKEKIESLGAIAHWHLIGRLQTNKAKYAV